MDNEYQTQAQNLFIDLCKSEEQVGEARKLMREFESLRSTALDALHNIRGATPRDEFRVQVAQERAEVVAERCRKYLADHSNQT